MSETNSDAYDRGIADAYRRGYDDGRSGGLAVAFVALLIGLSIGAAVEFFVGGWCAKAAPPVEDRKP